jgi:uncharacterized protein with HEPN domain
MKKPNPHIAFIQETLQLIRENTPKNQDDFMKDRNAQDATLMRLQDVGEQLVRIRDGFPEFYDQNETDEWHKLIGLRNIISHGYREIDFEIIWLIVTEKLQNFENHINSLPK